jgi:uncharacterized protein YfaS (alpha-2-macroglobulin family)
LFEASPTGRATIEFNLPDAPATYRLRAEAHYNGRIGTAEAKIISRPPE